MTSTLSPDISAQVPSIVVPEPRPLHPRERAERVTRWVVTAVVAIVLLYGFH